MTVYVEKKRLTQVQCTANIINSIKIATFTMLFKVDPIPVESFDTCSVFGRNFVFVGF